MLDGLRGNALTPECTPDRLPPDLSIVSSGYGFEFIDCKPRLSSFKKAVWTGLESRPKMLDPMFFYDDEGSRLFERICETPEYYPTRCETSILQTYAGEMQAEIGNNPVLIEFGSGNSQKIRLLLDRLKPSAYVAVEISRQQLIAACGQLSSLYPQLPITGICADYCQPLPLLKVQQAAEGRRVAFFPGSTIGNFTPERAVEFLSHVRAVVGAGGGLLIGVDMKKNTERLNAAYNDREGVTAAFNLNLLHRINRELQADFDVEHFHHYAFYNTVLGRVEMHLVSQCRQQVSIQGKTFFFEQGESIHTENSYKYTVEEFRSLAQQAGFVAGKVWFDKDRLFSVHYLRAV